MTISFSPDVLAKAQAEKDKRLPAELTRPKRVRKTGNARPLPILDTTQRLRIGHLMTLLGVSSSTVYRRMASGDIPPPDHVIAGHPMWDMATFLPLVESLNATIKKRRRRKPGKQSHATAQATANVIALNGGHHEN
jgi:hypothetical protein